MTITIPGKYVDIVLSALEERVTTLSTLSVLLPTRYPLNGRAAEEIHALNEVIEDIKDGIIAE